MTAQTGPDGLLRDLTGAVTEVVAPSTPQAMRPASDMVEAGRRQRPGTDLAQAAQDRQGVGLCLSGGGYRAALFHVGALRRLDELGVLAGLRTVSGVSGGSLVANLLMDPRLRWPDPTTATAPGVDDGDLRVGGLADLVVDVVRAMASVNIRTPALLGRLRPGRVLRPDGAIRALADEFVELVPWWATPLREVPVAGPGCITGATEVGYGVDWRFADPTAVNPHGMLGDYRHGFGEPPAWLRVADTVAASCAYPPVFAPYRLDGRELELSGGVPGRESDEVRRALAADIRLTDGGVYDNLGLEPVWKDHRTVLVSDGGGVFRARTTRTPFGQALRIMSLAADGGTALRLRWLHARIEAGEMSGATWALDEIVPGSYDAAVVEAINAVRTDLDAFSRGEQKILERHGYVVADQVVHRRVPELIRRPAPLEPLYPEVADPGVAAEILAGSARRTVLGRWSA